jgi:hypothetical protein
MTGQTVAPERRCQGKRTSADRITAADEAETEGFNLEYRFLVGGVFGHALSPAGSYLASRV